MVLELKWLSRIRKYNCVTERKSVKATYISLGILKPCCVQEGKQTCIGKIWKTKKDG